MRTLRLPLVLAAAAVFAVAAAPLAAQAGGGHAMAHQASGWAEMDAYHEVLMETWHAADERDDLAPIRAKAALLAARADDWAAAPPPKRCDTPALRSAVGRVWTESRALAALVKGGAPDAKVRAALSALHDRFETVERGCRPAPGLR